MKKSVAAVQNSDIPKKFYKESKAGFPSCSTVKELKAILNELPDDLFVANDSSFEHLRVSVTNNGIDAPTEPYVCFESVDAN